MAKKMAQQEFSDADGETWGDKVPQAVQDAADAYEKALKAKNKAAGNFNTAKDNIIAQMKEHGVTKVRVRDGSKYLEMSVDEKVKLHKIKEPTAAVQESDD